MGIPIAGERSAELLEAVLLRYQAAGLDPDRSLVILCRTDVYQPIVDAYYSAGVALGADPVLITYKSRPARTGLPDGILEMVSTADQLVDLGYQTHVYTDAQLKIESLMKEKGGRILDRHPFAWEEEVNIIINCTPSEEVTERVEHARRMIDAAKQIRITSDLGTDLSFARGDPKERLSYTHFPPSQVAISPPEESINGVVYFVGSFRIEFPIPHKTRMVYEPVEMEFEKGRLVNVHRDNEVGILLDEWFKSHNDPNSYQFSHINVGLDHRVVLEWLDTISTHFKYGGICMGIGCNNWPGWGKVDAQSHVDMALVGADYLLDGKPILKGGEFTVGSGLRAPGRA